ncbi:MAG TPA: DUF4157 domain-containing protein, partial [Flavitalea sp.]|nr:DUF4157 domain-containing protein [Flavitalea sp.]
MKAVGPTTTSAPAKSDTPFFKKGGEGEFVGESAGKQPFFKSSGAPKPFFQTKLSVGQTGDHYEREADAMADKVVQRLATPDIRAKKDPAIQPKPLTHGITPLVQSKCASCEQEEKLKNKDDEAEGEQPELQKKPIFESNGDPPEDKFSHFQRKPIFESNADPMEEQLQRKEAGTSATAASSAVESGISSTRSGGSPLSPETNASMSNSFGTDFSGVRIHNDSSAAQLSKDLNAQAFTHGNDIYFNSGKYDTNSTAGKHLLA